MAAEMSEAREAGAQAERRRRNKWWAILGAAVLSGFAAGLGFVALKKGKGLADGTIPPWLAIVIAASYAATLLFGSVMATRVADELEKHNNRYGLAMGASALLLVYPIWWVLWRGELVGEPSHVALFAILFVSAGLAYLFKKFS